MAGLPVRRIAFWTGNYAHRYRVLTRDWPMFLVYGALRIVRALFGLLLLLPVPGILMHAGASLFYLILDIQNLPHPAIGPPMTDPDLTRSLILMGVAGFVFGALQVFINWVHLRHRGVPHPKMKDDWSL